MSLEFRKARPVPLDIYPDDLRPLIDSFIHWIGPASVKAMLLSYRQADRASGAISAARMLERQPLLEGFDEYLALLQTSPDGVPFAHAPPRIAWLARISQLHLALAPTLKGQVDADHRVKLLSLSGQCSPLLVEWTMANFYSRKYGAELAWTPTHEKGPELIARAGLVEWELECKRISHMIFEKFGDFEADALAATCILALRNRSESAVVSIEIPPARTAFSLDELGEITSFIELAMTQGDTEILVFDGLKISIAMNRHETHARMDLLQANLAQAQRNGARVYFEAIREPLGSARNPIAITILAARKHPNDVFEQVWNQRFAKAAKQCSGTRGAVLAFEWSFVEDPADFKEPFFQALMMRTFDEFRHVAAIVMLCNSIPKEGRDSVIMNNVGFIGTSNVCLFPEIAALDHFDDIRTS